MVVLLAATGQLRRGARRDRAAGHGAEQAVARQVAPDRVAGDAARRAAGGQQVGQGVPSWRRHAALRVDVEAALGVEQRAGDLDGVVRRSARERRRRPAQRPAARASVSRDASQPISARQRRAIGGVRTAPAASASTKSGKPRASASSRSSNTFQAMPPGCASTCTAASE